jgi:NAD(P)-dependent dehydrogenase (short-subunit alcohol dehydrogenase family)
MSLTAGQSKLAVILYTRSLANKLSDRQVFVNSVNPGDVATGNLSIDPSDLDMMRNVFDSYSRITTWLYDQLNPFFFVTPYKGALNSLYAATSPDIRQENMRGKYFNPIGKVGEVHEFAMDDRRAEALWNLSELLLKGRGFEIPEI